VEDDEAMTDERACPLCGHDLSVSMCDHLVADLPDDMEREDSHAIPFCGYVEEEGWTDAHDDMCDAFDAFFTALSNVCVHALLHRITLNQVERLCNKPLADPERQALQQAFKTARDAVDQAGTAEVDETEEGSVVNPLDLADGSECANVLFDRLYGALVDKPITLSYEILSGPGYTWTGKMYFAREVKPILSAMSARLRDHAGMLQQVVAQMERQK
jgi:hypothetical protein